jgi:hypothetical protein
MNLDQYLARQRAGGQEDSEGVFTLAIQKASWKLAEFRLTEPGLFPVHLAACAVASGANEFHVFRDLQDRTDRFRFNGAHFSLEDLEILNRPLLSSSIPRHLRELGIALNAAEARGTARFLSFSPAGGAELLLDGGDVKLSEVPGAQDSGQVLEVTYHKLGLPSFGLLKERCRYAPLDLKVNGQRHRDSFDLGMSEHMLYGHFHRQGTEELMVRPARLAEYEVFSHCEKSPGERSMAVGLTWPEFASRHGWVFVADGVSYRLEQNLTEFPFFCGAVAVSGLEKDLSQAGFLRNDDFEGVLQEIREACEVLLRRICAQPKTLEASMSRNHLDLFQTELLRHYANRDIPSDVGAFLAQTEKSDSDLKTLKKVADRARRSGRMGPLRRVCQTLRSKASLAYSRGHREEAIIWLRKASSLLAMARSSGPELERLLYYLYHVHELGNMALDEVRDPESHACRFRDLLANLGSLTTQEISARLEELEVDHSWKAPVHALLAYTSPVLAILPDIDIEGWGEAFRVWRYCEEKQFAEARKVLKAQRRRPNGEASYRLWLLILWKLYRGQMPLALFFRWRVQINVDSWFTTDTPSKRGRYYLHNGMCLTKPVSAYFRDPGLAGVLLPLVFGRLMYLAKVDKGILAREFLGRILLQCTLIGSNGELGASELPDFPSSFPPLKSRD